MKSTVLALTAFLAAASAYAQGTLNFTTKSGTSVDARVFYGSPTTPAGADYVGQLYAGAAGGALTAIGAPVAFRGDPPGPAAAVGYILGAGTVVVPGVAGGSAADVQLRAWRADLGASYEAAVAAQGGAYTGSSATLRVAALGNPSSVPPTPAANLVGLQGFVIPVPEPSIAALGLLGAGLLVIRRKK